MRSCETNTCSYTVGPPTEWGPGVYAELHCHSNFSFLDGASHPEELAEEAARLGLAALALTDHDGFYGVVRFAEAARPLGLPDRVRRRDDARRPRARRTGIADPPGEHLVVLAQGTGRLRAPRQGDQRGAARGGEGRAAHVARDLADAARAPVHGHDASRAQRPLVRARPAAARAPCRPRCNATVPAAAERALRELVDAFGRDRVLVELWDHGDPLDRHRNDALAQIALRAGVEVVATNNVHYATPGPPPARDTRSPRCGPAVRSTRSTAGCPPRSFAHLRSAGRTSCAGSRAGPARSNAPSRSRARARST